jgi:hypothetical protein
MNTSSQFSLYGWVFLNSFYNTQVPIKTGILKADSGTSNWRLKKGGNIL